MWILLEIIRLVWLTWEICERTAGGMTLREDTKAQRRRRAEATQRRRRLTIWWWSKGRRGPLPDWGYACESCQYPLAGLRDPRCPECGTLFVPLRALRE